MENYMQYQNPPAQAPVYAQQQIIMINQQSKKSPGIAFALTFFFGPLGLFYASITGGIVMLLLEIPVLFLTFGLGLFFTNIICVVWAMVAVSNYNKKISQPAQFNQFVPPTQQPPYQQAPVYQQPAYQQPPVYAQQQQTPPVQEQQPWQPYMPPAQAPAQSAPVQQEAPQPWKPYMPTPPAQEQPVNTAYKPLYPETKQQQGHKQQTGISQQTMIYGIAGVVGLALIVVMTTMAFGGNGGKTPTKALGSVSASGKTPAVAAVKTGYIQTEKGSSLRLRSEPSETSVVMTNIPNNSRVVILAYDKKYQVVNGEVGKWCNVQYGGTSGWVWGKFVKPN